MVATDNEQGRRRRPRVPSKGRRKIELKKVEKQSSRYVTFSKRKKGLFRKATEISTLCDAQVAVLVFSENGKVFTFGHSDVDNVLDRYLSERGGDHPADIVNGTAPGSSVSKVNEYCQQEYMESVDGMEEQRGVAVGKNIDNSREFWWDLHVEKMGMEELEAYQYSLKELKNNVTARMELMGASAIINQFVNQSETSPHHLWFFDGKS